MLSILIPTYNYNAYPLVFELYNQCNQGNIEFEIICFDDASNSNENIENQKINALENCKFSINSKNIGRTANRNLLAEQARFNLLLFLDADVIPEKNNFIKIYLENQEENQVVFGGYKYNNTVLNTTNSLRYFYGKKREEVGYKRRSKNPYNYVFSGNMLINKNTFLAHNKNFIENIYGLDILLGYNLFIKNVEVIHIDNAIFHNGIEENEVFFKKSLESVASRKKYLIDKKNIEKVNLLIKNYKFLKQYKLDLLVFFLFTFTKPVLKKLIFKKQPSLLAFDLYRLGYICSIK